MDRLRGEAIRAAEAAGLPFSEVRQVLDAAEDWMRGVEDWRPRGKPGDASEAQADRTTAYRQIIEALWEMRHRLDGRQLAGAPAAPDHAGLDPSSDGPLSVKTPPACAIGDDPATDRSEPVVDPTDPRYDIPFHVLNAPPPPREPRPVPLHRAWLEPYPENAEALWQWCMRHIEDIRRAKAEGGWLVAGPLAMAAVDDVVTMMKALGVPVPAQKPLVPDPAAPGRSADDAIQFLADCASLCRRAAPPPAGEAVTPDPEQGASAADGNTPQVPEGKKARRPMSVEEVNEKAMDLAKKMKDEFFLLSERKQAERIGCAWETWSKTEFYKKAKEKRAKLVTRMAKGNTSGAAPAVSMTDKVEAAMAEGKPSNEVVDRVIADENAARAKARWEASAPNRGWEELSPEEQRREIDALAAADDAELQRLVAEQKAEEKADKGNRFHPRKRA
jgi:hypothetical protein